MNETLSSSQSVAPTSAGADEPICFCFGISRETILDHIRRPGSTYESLITETGIGTKCTACRLNLEVLLGDTVHFQRDETKGSHSLRWKIVNDQLNCAFFFARPDMYTVIRVGNPEFPLVADAPITAHNWSLTLYEPGGRSVHADRGYLPAGEAVAIDLSRMPALPEFGWFTLDMTPCGDALVGCIRPQCLLVGPRWAVTYHGQLTMYAGKRRTVMVTTDGGRYNTIFPVLNTNPDASDVLVEVVGLSSRFQDKAELAIPGYGAALIDLDQALRQPPPDQISMVAVNGTKPLRCFFMHGHGDGSCSVDHFPNTR